MKKILEELNKDIAEYTRDIKEREAFFKENIKKERTAFRQKYGQKEFDLGLDLYEGKSFLMIPHFPNDKGNLRLRANTLNSAGVVVKKSNIPVNDLGPSQSYQIECTVENHGDLAVPLANVEFFVSPKFKPHELEMEITGTSYFLGTTIKGTIKKGSIQLLDHVRILCEDHVIQARVNGIVVHPPSGPTQTSTEATAGQKVTLYVGLSKTLAQTLVFPGSLLVEGLSSPPLNQLAFRFRVKDVFKISGRGLVVTGIVEQGTLKPGERINVFKGDSGRGNILNITVSKIERMRRSLTLITPGMEVGLLLGNHRGTIQRGDLIVKSNREEFTGIAEPIPEPDKVADYEFLGRKTIAIPAMESQSISMPFQTTNSKDRNEFIFVCRVFATLPVDMPDNFNVLIPKLERRVGAKKIPWKSS